MFHNKHKKRDPYEKHPGSYMNGRPASHDHVYDRNNDGNSYGYYSGRNYVEYEEKPRGRLKDPYSTEYDPRNFKYMENKPNSTNGCYRYDVNESNVIYSNNSAPVNYQPRYRELPYKRKESHRNYSNPYNVPIPNPPETRQQIWSGKQQPLTKQSQNIGQNKDNLSRTEKGDHKNQPTKSTDNQKNDPQHSVNQNSVSTTLNPPHADKLKSNMSNSTKIPVKPPQSPSIASNTKAGDGNKKPIETENKTPKESKPTSEKTNNNGSKSLNKMENSTIKSKEPSLSTKVETKRTSRRINKVADEEQEEDETVSKRKTKRKTVASPRVLRIRKGTDESNGNEASKGKSGMNKGQESKSTKETELPKKSNSVSSSSSSSDTNVVNMRRSNTTNASSSSTENMEECSNGEGKQSSTDSEEYITPRSVGFSEKKSEESERRRRLQTVNKGTNSKTQKKTNKIADLINLNRKITRNTQSFYESQLKMAIELSMKECDANENTCENKEGKNKENKGQDYKHKEYNGCGNRGDRINRQKDYVHNEGENNLEREVDYVHKEKNGCEKDTESDIDKEGDYDAMNLDRGKEDSNIDRRDNVGGNKENIREKEEYDHEDGKTNNKNSSYSCEKKQHGYEKKEYIDSPIETSDSDSDYDDKKPMKKTQKQTQKASTERKTKVKKQVQSKRGSKTKKKVEVSDEIAGGNNLNINIRGAVNGSVQRSGNLVVTGNIFGNMDSNTTRGSGLLLQGGLEAFMSEDIMNNAMPLGILTNERELTASDESIMSAVNQFRSAKMENVSDQVLMQMKMKAFEEFLTMSERLYCGRPLVDEYTAYTLNAQYGTQEMINTKDKDSDCSTNYSNSTEDGPSSKDSSSGNIKDIGMSLKRDTGVANNKEGIVSPTRGGGNQQSKLGTTTIKDYAIQVSKDLNLGFSNDFVTEANRDVSMSPGGEIGRNQQGKESVNIPRKELRMMIPKDTHGLQMKEGILNISREGKKENEDELFKFNCSKLDLMYRVSFNILKSSHRQPEVIDLWGPKELVLFELALFKYGKEFHEIQKDIPTKSVKEIVDMYYLWKKTSRYKLWKANRYY
ncbi:metastasis-associated protein MTA2 [Theileria orientalis]|uniref:Metastasis-associated protein MTA2 n=1 Tax=Theileria orientalis TaxID=68886 RepID=A0A976QWQ0_THEOR|nr:metastasis-associated protein MTA2 [Theileria orientalis]